jgi:hypothetical protein
MEVVRDLRGMAKQTWISRSDSVTYYHGIHFEKYLESCFQEKIETGDYASGNCFGAFLIVWNSLRSTFRFMEDCQLPDLLHFGIKNPG